MGVELVKTPFGLVSMTPLSLDGLAVLVRAGALPRAGGDEVLRRAGFRWSERGRAARGSSWHEAEELCRHVGGRLPWLQEWTWIATPVAAGAYVPPPAFPAYQPGLGAFTSATGFLIEGELGEWCGDWYHPAGSGPDVVAEPPLRRRIGGGRSLPAVSPDRVGGDIAFRIVLPSSWRPSRPLRRVFEIQDLE